jgi:hypothetical protein
MEKLPVWRFEVRDKIWSWEREEGSGHITKMGPFPTFILCMIAAERHGYDPEAGTKYTRVRLLVSPTTP